jgi:FkbM family methyltransferase
VSRVSHLSAETIVRNGLGVRGDIKRVVFEEGTHRISCLVPDDNLWGAVKDNLILSEYERCGISLGEPRGTVVDAGAHVGLFSLRVAHYASNVISIEPHPLMSTLLELNLRRNHIRNVGILRRALWGTKGSVTLSEGAHSGASVVSGGESEGYNVKAITLDDLVQLNGPIDLLKLDIEGAEFEVIANARSSTLGEISTIVGELHGWGQGQPLGQLVEKLRSVGFSVTVRPPPSQLWRESVSRLLTNWRKVRGNTRLKALVLGAYTLTALERSVLKSSGTAKSDLVFLYAQRNAHGTRGGLARSLSR